MSDEPVSDCNEKSVQRTTASEVEPDTATPFREPELDVGPPEAPDVHPRPLLLARGLPEPLPTSTRWLLVGLAIAAALLAAAYSPLLPV